MGYVRAFIWRWLLYHGEFYPSIFRILDHILCPNLYNLPLFKVGYIGWLDIIWPWINVQTLCFPWFGFCQTEIPNSGYHPLREHAHQLLEALQNNALLEGPKKCLRMWYEIFILSKFLKKFLQSKYIIKSIVECFFVVQLRNEIMN